MTTMDLKPGDVAACHLYCAGCVTTEHKVVLRVTDRDVWLDNGGSNDPSGPFDRRTGWHREGAFGRMKIEPYAVLPTPASPAALSAAPRASAAVPPLTYEEWGQLRWAWDRCEAGLAFTNDEMSRVLVLVDKLRRHVGADWDGVPHPALSAARRDGGGE
jgi:hypothetical protein